MSSRALLLTALLPLSAAAGCHHDESIAERQQVAAALEAERAAIRAELKELRAEREAAAAYQAAATYQPAAYQTASYPSAREIPADLVVESIPSSQPGEPVAYQQEQSSSAPSIYIAPALRRPNPEVLDLREREIARRERELRRREAQAARVERTAPIPTLVYRETEPVALEPEAEKPAARIEPPAEPVAPVAEPTNQGLAVSRPSPQEDEPVEVSSPPQVEEVVPPPGDGDH